MLESTLAAVLGVVASLLASLVSYAASRRRKRHDEILAAANEQVSISVEPVRTERNYRDNGGDIEFTSTAELFARMEQQILARVQSSVSVPREQIQKEIRRQIADVEDCIRKIEGRFPEEAKIEKIASINDVLLTARIDQLSEQLKHIEERILSKWDVAVVVGLIIAGIIAIVGATYAVLKATGTIP